MPKGVDHSKDQPRQKGKYDFKPRSDAGQLFDAKRDADREARIAAMTAGGYAPPVVAQTDIDPNSFAQRDQWWDQSFVTGEYDNSEGEYPQMPDDNTPNQHDGSALSGKRRTHRMAYRGDDVTVRMPSQRAIKRFAAERNNGTFDVPVSADTPEGTVHGWVRVTPGADGKWHTQGLGADGDTETYLAESVRTVLESRRPRTALAGTGSILERARQRRIDEGAEMTPVDSSWVRGVAFNEHTGALTVDLNGREYSYQSDRETYDELMNSGSIGAAYNRLIKRQADYTAEPQTKCPKCGRYAGSAHRCPVTKPREAPHTVDQNERARKAAVRALGARTVSTVDSTAWMRTKWREEAAAGRVDPSVPSTLGRSVKRNFTASPAASAAISRHATGATRDGSRLVIDGVDATASRQLVTALPAENLRYAARDGAAPTTHNILRSVNNSNGKLTARGTVVPPSSPDEKVELTGVYLDSDADNAGRAMQEAAALGLRAQQMPSDVRQVERHGKKVWYLGW